MREVHILDSLFVLDLVQRPHPHREVRLAEDGGRAHPGPQRPRLLSLQALQQAVVGRIFLFDMCMSTICAPREGYLIHSTSFENAAHIMRGNLRANTGTKTTFTTQGYKVFLTWIAGKIVPKDTKFDHWSQEVTLVFRPSVLCNRSGTYGMAGFDARVKKKYIAYGPEAPIDYNNLTTIIRKYYNDLRKDSLQVFYKEFTPEQLLIFQNFERNEKFWLSHEITSNTSLQSDQVIAVIMNERNRGKSFFPAKIPIIYTHTDTTWEDVLELVAETTSTRLLPSMQTRSRWMLPSIPDTTRTSKTSAEHGFVWNQPGVTQASLRKTGR
jgi:hypothetical protein